MKREITLSEHQIQNLIQGAMAARKNAYVPYSNYSVGAALLDVNGKMTLGCNIENASYGATICAERTAVFKAVSEGRRTFIAIAICGGIKDMPATEYAYPCGICRQVLQEFSDEDFFVIIVKSLSEYKVFRLNELLPYSFKGGLIK